MRRSFLLVRVVLAVLASSPMLYAAVAPALTTPEADGVRGRHVRGDSRQEHGDGPARRVTGVGGALALAAARDNRFGSPAGGIERRLPVQPNTVVISARPTPRH
jgi:hypothetical protein